MFAPLFALHGGGQEQHFLTMQKLATPFSLIKTAQPGSSVSVDKQAVASLLHGGYGAAFNDKGAPKGRQAGMKILTPRRLGATLTTLALATTPAEAVNFAVSTQNFETIVELTSVPLPSIPAPSAGAVVQISGKVICDEGSITLRMGGDAETPGLTIVFHAGAVSLAPDGVMPLDVASVPGRGMFDFRLSIRHLGNPVRKCVLEVSSGGGGFEPVAQMDWPTPRFPHQEPMAWLETGTVTAGFAGKCTLSNLEMRCIVPGTLLFLK